MGIESFLKRWTIRESTSSLIAVDNKLNIDRVGNSNKVKFRCKSPNPDTIKSWDEVKNCKWFPDGNSAGHLAGSISDQSGGDYTMTLNHADGGPNRIHIDFVAASARGTEVAALGDGGAGSAEGDDEI